MVMMKATLPQVPKKDNICESIKLSLYEWFKLWFGVPQPIGENPPAGKYSMRITEVDREITPPELDSVERFADNMFGKLVLMWNYTPPR